jgi:Ca-activated chloride channel family protein
MLLGLIAVPLVVVWYRRLLRARAARRAELAALGLVAREVRPRRRYLPAALLLGALVLLLVALGRPEVSVPLPRREGTVILAVDTSASMAATDLTPSRMDAAKAAARAFVARQPPAVRLGVVAFSGSGLVTQEVTADRASVIAAIDRLRPDGATALGRGLQTSLTAIVGKPVLVNDPGTAGGSPGVEQQGPDLGYHGSAVVVLFTDGENTDQPDPLDVAEIASSAGVKVYPVGLGRPEGAVLQIGGFSLATALDEPMLQEIATRTDGRYIAGADAQALAGISDVVDLQWTVEVRHIEVTALLAAAAAVLMLVGVGLSLAWFGRAV